MAERGAAETPRDPKHGLVRGPFVLPRLARIAFVIGGVLPWLVPWIRAGGFPRLGVILDAIFVPLCHRLPARTLLVGGVAMPLCSRCAGLFSGVAMGALIARPAWSQKRWRRVLVATFALMLAEIAAQDLGLHPIWHASRLLTGALFGYAIGAATITALYANARAEAASEAALR
ncbi:MAG: DUF2085 domain-containing protein [Byssovorax sp.]